MVFGTFARYGKTTRGSRGWVISEHHKCYWWECPNYALLTDPHLKKNMKKKGVTFKKIISSQFSVGQSAEIRNIRDDDSWKVLETWRMTKNLFLSNQPDNKLVKLDWTRNIGEYIMAIGLAQWCSIYFSGGWRIEESAEGRATIINNSALDFSALRFPFRFGLWLEILMRFPLRGIGPPLE